MKSGMAFDFIARISALNLIIENQNKSISFDTVVEGVLTKPRDYYTGSLKMSNGKFRKIVAQIEAMEISRLIDSAGNAFIERVLYYGNHWIYAGINYMPAYSLQGFINVLCLRNHTLPGSFTSKAHRLINCILQLCL